tara:strand:- start:3086 stop:4837 length:1752 start_codon:yes stop_codon:yes gene_type:complete
MVILGFNSFHADSAACLLVDGKLVSAVSEERLGQRIKHDSSFPANAIRRVLLDSNLSLRDVSYVAIARDPGANLSAKFKYVSKNPIKSAGAVVEHFKRGKKVKSIFDQLADACDEDKDKLNLKVIEVEHHLAHVASAYYVSPFETLTAGFSYDGSGDFASLMAAKCEGNKIEVLDKVLLPNSLGFFYTALCQFIGFDDFGEEYKVMGLAPYGQNTHKQVMEKLVKLNEDRWFELEKGCFGMHSGGSSDDVDEENRIRMGKFYTNKLEALLGKPRPRNQELSQKEMDIAKSTQVRFEEASVHCIKKLHSLVPTNQLAMAGGCALNGVANARILRETEFTTPYLQPASSDDGTCLGAAFHVWHETLGREERFHMKHAFWGPEYSDEQIRKVAEKSSFLVKKCKDHGELIDEASTLLSKGLVVGWYQGRSEWGPRALGNRSILADPSVKDMKNIINSKIKRRESFRPFAPSVLKEDVTTYFEQDVDSPFMMHVVKVKEKWQKRLPAITHVDGTGRLQTVDKQSNSLYYDLISKFKSKTGIGMLLNTSFNENEPVVDTPQQAYDCFNRTDMDAMCLGNYILKKKDKI